MCIRFFSFFLSNSHLVCVRALIINSKEPVSKRGNLNNCTVSAGCIHYTQLSNNNNNRIKIWSNCGHVCADGRTSTSSYHILCSFSLIASPTPRDDDDDDQLPPSFSTLWKTSGCPSNKNKFQVVFFFSFFARNRRKKGKCRSCY